MPSPRRLAVVLFNLGGPDGPKAVRPFLFNLFADPAIIAAPAFIRYPLAILISRTRERAARLNYARMGGGSPLLPETQAQAAALAAALARQAPGIEARVFIAMRYWAPLTGQTAKDVAAFAPDDIVLTPLYPHFSTTTTGSSLKAWNRTYRGSGRGHTLCCYPTLDGLIEGHAERIRTAWERAGRPQKVRLLFSAHGLPQQVVDRGDPYPSQIQATARAVAARLEDILPDWGICYQSRVGPMKWLAPSTPDAIQEAIAEGLGIVITPIAFVSEHIETLVELDHDYATLAQSAGCEVYIRAPALGVQPAFIDGLAAMIHGATGETVAPGSAFRCEACWSWCARAKEARLA